VSVSECACVGSGVDSACWACECQWCVGAWKVWRGRVRGMYRTQSVARGRVGVWVVRWVWERGYGSVHDCVSVNVKSKINEVRCVCVGWGVWVCGVHECVRCVL
jgi:hypothetical protein